MFAAPVWGLGEKGYSLNPLYSVELLVCSSLRLHLPLVTIESNVSYPSSLNTLLSLLHGYFMESIFPFHVLSSSLLVGIYYDNVCL